MLSANEELSYVYTALAGSFVSLQLDKTAVLRAAIPPSSVFNCIEIQRCAAGLSRNYVHS